MQQRPPYVFPILAFGVIAVSFAAVLIRRADAPAIVIAAYRLGLAGLPVGLLAATAARRSLPRRREWIWPIVAGTALALHFGFWITSVQQTSVVTSVVLVTTTPLFIGLASPLVLKESVAPTTWAGIVISAAGAAVMAADDLGEGLGTLSGDAYALLGAIFAAVYFLAGRRSRQTTPLAGYVGVVYPIAGVLLIASAVVAGESFTGYNVGTYTAIVLLAVLPQLIGHSSIDWALGYVPATLVAVSILGEPVVATGLAAVFLDEQPNVLEGIGSVFVLAGVYVALRPVAAPAQVVEQTPAR